MGWKNRTINMPMEVVRRILNLAAGEWLDEHGLTWLQSAPKIRLLPRDDAREPYPLSWDEQTRLFAALPEHLRMMCLFAVNTGLRNKEVCGLRWDDEVEIEALETSVFIIPKERVKNKEDRLVVLNRVAKAVIDRVRGDHPTWVFTLQGRSGEEHVQYCVEGGSEDSGLAVRENSRSKAHLRSQAAVDGCFVRGPARPPRSQVGEDHDSLSAPELISLIQASERVCGKNWCKSGAVTILRRKIPLRLASNRAG